MLEAKNCNVFINGTGLMVQSASINSSNSTLPVQSIGKRGFSKYIANGPITHSVSLDYILKTDNEPNYQIYNAIKNHVNSTTFQECELVIGGISGSFYLDSYSVSSSPNNLTTARASYISFEETLSGYLDDSKTPKETVDYVSSTTGFSNGWVTYFYEEGELAQNSVYDFSYSFQSSWEPSYIIGSKVPSQVDLMGYSESITVLRDIYTKPVFSGEDLYFSQDISGNFIGVDKNSDLRVYGLWNLCNGSGDFLNFSLSGSSINSSSVNYSLGDIILTETSASKIG
jgi:hypothetical protein